jgi:hypothetical protein
MNKPMDLETSATETKPHDVGASSAGLYSGQNLIHNDISGAP